MVFYFWRTKDVIAEFGELPFKATLKHELSLLLSDIGLYQCSIMSRYEALLEANTFPSQRRLLLALLIKRMLMKSEL